MKLSKGNALVVILAILVVISTSLAIYFYFQSQKRFSAFTQKGRVETDSKLSPTVTSELKDPIANDSQEPATTPVANGPNNWTGLGVSFNYPGTWSVKKPVSMVTKPESGGYYKQSFSSGEKITLLLSLQPRDRSDFVYPNQVTTMIGGNNGIKAEYSSSEGSKVYQFFARTAYDENTDVSIMIYVQPADEQSKQLARSAFDQILSTFRILE